MRLLNGLFAFATIFFLTVLVLDPPEAFSDQQMLICLVALIFWHIFWFLHNWQRSAFIRKHLLGLPLFIILSPIALGIGSLLANLCPIPTAWHLPTILLVKGLAVADLLYCLKRISASLPPSMSLRQNKDSRLVSNQAAAQLSLEDKG